MSAINATGQDADCIAVQFAVERIVFAQNFFRWFCFFGFWACVGCCLRV
jgi:hypothetical protein